MTHEEATQAWYDTKEVLGTEDQIVNDIMMVAFNHDTTCQNIFTSIYADLEKPNPPSELIDRIGYLCFALIALCAALGEGARARAREAKLFSEGIIEHNLISDLRDNALRQFMRPLFDDAGLGDQFEVRMNRAVSEYINSRKRSRPAAA
jgi:hypothetical protein